MGKVEIRAVDWPAFEIDEARILRLPPREPGEIALVANLVRIDSELPFAFCTGCVLEKATGEDLKLIQQRLTELAPGDSLRSLRKLYEQEDIAYRTPQTTGYSTQPLPEDEWRYYILRTDDHGAKSQRLHKLANITDTPLDVQSLIIYSKTGFRYREQNFKRHHSGGPQKRFIITVDITELETLRQLFTTWSELESETKDGEPAYPEVTRALSMFENLTHLDPCSDFHILGLFAIIEMLVTYEPEGSGDASITTQIRRKIPMLLRRFDTSIAVPSEIGKVSTESVWKALYDLRSNLAHGAAANFNKGKHCSLRSQRIASEYLTEVVKALIRFSIQSPILLRDIKGI